MLVGCVCSDCDLMKDQSQSRKWITFITQQLDSISRQVRMYFHCVCLMCPLLVTVNTDVCSERVMAI